MIRRAKRSGGYIRQVGSAWREKGRLKAQVAFQRFPAEDPFAFVRGTSSALRIETDCMCPQMIFQENPGLKDTAYGVINDLMTIVRSGFE
jgi:homoserine dehydrogenase